MNMERPVPFRLGFMLRIPTPWEGAGDTDVRQMFADALTLAEAADQLGFDSLWLTQHHFGAVDSALPSPLVFHAAIAARTRHIRLGTTVITAPLEHPIRLAEDAATLDTISGGRVELGLGTSSDRIERDAFGVAVELQREALHQTALRLKRAFAGNSITDDPAIVVEPRSPALARRMWLATTTRAHALFAAEHGFGMIANYRPATLDDSQRDYGAAYAETARQRGFAPRMGLSRSVFPTPDPVAARRQLMPHAERFAERGKRYGWVPPTFTPDDFFHREDFHFGHPSEVVESIRRDPGLPYATELLTGMLSARLTPRELLPVLERIAIDVAPALGWKPCTERTAAAASV
jgi:alkanesulfonate monooxygenase SsuD/methylene tetrahydromethanopterin reductase-like flavin-dependent oxidoreductase (luciferase family)